MRASPAASCHLRALRPHDLRRAARGLLCGRARLLPSEYSGGAVSCSAVKPPSMTYVDRFINPEQCSRSLRTPHNLRNRTVSLTLKRRQGVVLDILGSSELACPGAGLKLSGSVSGCSIAVDVKGNLFVRGIEVGVVTLLVAIEFESFDKAIYRGRCRYTGGPVVPAYAHGRPPPFVVSAGGPGDAIVSWRRWARYSIPIGSEFREPNLQVRDRHLRDISSRPAPVEPIGGSHIDVIRRACGVLACDRMERPEPVIRPPFEFL